MTYSMVLGFYLGMALWFAEQMRISLGEHESLQKKCTIPEVRNAVSALMTVLCLIWPLTLIWAILEVEKEK